jgi:4,5:9,10-diseco-3-hydroxy-5,9,17-trioxoandrosta-1(10),2-diene-4-oate hydrolase
MTVTGSRAKVPQIPGTSEHWTELDGCRVRYLTVGAGEPLLLIHGLLGYSFSWRHNFQALGAAQSLYAIDLPGTGFSERRLDLDCGMRPSAERILRFLDALEIDSADVIATSHGGALAMYMAALAPERIRKFVLVAPANPWSQFGRHLIWGFGNPFGAAAMRAAVPAMLHFGHDFVLERLYGDVRRISPGTLEGYRAPFEIPGAIDYALQVVRMWRRDMTQLAAMASQFRVAQTLILWGSADRAVDPGSAQELEKRLPNSEVKILRGVGHLPYEETPQEFNDAVLQFLAQ